MEFIILGILPVALLAGFLLLLVVSQVSSLLQSRSHGMRERRSSRVIASYLQELAMTQTELGRRARELDRLTRDLRLKNEELERLSHMKSRFLSMAVHDVRTPLAVIGGYGQMLARSGRISPQEARMAAIINTATDQISRLMGDLTDLAVIEAGKFRVEPAPFELAHFVSELSVSAALLAAKKGVVYDCPAPPAGVTVFADRFRVGRLLTNFLGNAIKFTPAGGRVELRTRVSGGNLVFEVKDTGPGIDPSERRKIFEKFYQSRFSDSKAKSGGWGLGLSIADEIARGHGGSIGVDSPGLGRGSTFWFKLPLRKAKAPAARLGLTAAALLLGLLVRPAAGQTIPLEEKARYERALEGRVNSVLHQLLGPNRAEVIVDATVDFTRIEKYEVKEGSRTVKSGEFLWESGAAAPAKELLPGITADDPLPAARADTPHPTSYERVNSFPTNFVKRLSVTLLLDRSISDAQVEDLKGMVTDVMNIRAERGDELTLVRADFVPPWKAIWREPEMAGVAMKYLVISLLSLLTLIVVGLCFMRVADAMNTMAKAQSQQMSMDMKGLSDMTGAGGEGDGVPALPGPDGDEAGAEGGPAGQTVYFEVTPEQVEPLAEMVESEDAANVALISVHLRPEIRRAFFEHLPHARRAAVVAAMGRVRFLEPEMILNLKEEVERRLSGAVGGIARLVEAVEAAPVDKREDMLHAVEALDPELAKMARRRLLLYEDLRDLRPADWNLMASRVPFEIWADALGPDPEAAIVEGLRAHLPEAGWKLLSQMASMSKVDATARATARTRVLTALAEMIASGAIPRPVRKAHAAPAEALPPKES